jgi:hypothetical protein
MESEYIRFVDVGKSASGKTNIWNVVSKSSEQVLAQIMWHGAWRQYVFRPLSGSIWNIDCLRDINIFMSSATTSHRTG